MAERVQIEVEITPDGEIKLTTHGLSGNACMEETAAMEKALGKVKDRTKTSEFFKQATGLVNKLRGK